MKSPRLTQDEIWVLTAMYAVVAQAWYSQDEASNGGFIAGAAPDQLDLKAAWIKSGKAAAICESLVRKGLLRRQHGADGFRRQGYTLRELMKAQRADLWYSPVSISLEGATNGLWHCLSACVVGLPDSLKRRILVDGVMAVIEALN